MAKLKKRKVSQPSSQDETLQHQITVPTPEIEVSLVDRMKRRFSTRNPSASEPSVSEGEPSTVSSQDSSVKETGSRRKTSKSNLAEKVTQIDKYFSPDVRSKKLFQSPTRFPIRSVLTSTDTEERLDGEQMSDNQNTTGPLEKDENNSDNTEEESGSASSDERNTENDSDNSPKTSLKRKDETQTSKQTKKRRSDYSPSTDDEGDGSGEQHEGGSEGQEMGKVSKKKPIKKKDIVIIASGEVEAHMADKEFISSQVRAMSTPFVLESGPRSWMNAWKAQQSSHNDELPDIPSSVIDRIVTKINFTMEDVYQRQLGRQQQRTTLMSLDELRKQPQEDSQSSLKPSLRDQSNLQEVISSYPSEWPGRVGEDKEMAERYASLRARLFALSRSESLSNQQRDQYKSLLGVLKMVHTNLEKHCSSQDLQQELKRSRDLIFKITQKLQSGSLGKGQNAMLKDGLSDSLKEPSVSLTNHNDLVKTLFKVAVSTESS